MNSVCPFEIFHFSKKYQSFQFKGKLWNLGSNTGKHSCKIPYFPKRNPCDKHLSRLSWSIQNLQKNLFVTTLQLRSLAALRDAAKLFLESSVLFSKSVPTCCFVRRSPTEESWAEMLSRTQREWKDEENDEEKERAQEHQQSQPKNGRYCHFKKISDIELSKKREIWARIC